MLTQCAVKTSFLMTTAWSGRSCVILANRALGAAFDDFPRFEPDWTDLLRRPNIEEPRRLCWRCAVCSELLALEDDLLPMLVFFLSDQALGSQNTEKCLRHVYYKFNLQ